MISKQIYNKMKKIFLSILILLLLSQVSLSYAQTPREGFLNTKTASNSSAREAIKLENQETQMTNLQNRAKTEITRRLDFLNVLLTKLDTIKKLSASDKAALKAQIQAQIDSLTALQAKINADTDLTTLRADVKSIINGYYIFAFFRVKIELLVAADRLSATTDNLDMIYAKLSKRVADDKSQGKDTTLLETELSQMFAKINDAKTQYQTAETELNKLTAQGFPGNKSVLLSSRSEIKLGASDLRGAFELANKIRLGLKEISGNKINTSTNSAIKN